MATKTATPNGKGSSGGGLGNMGVAALFRENANKAATKTPAVIENRPFKGEATATPNGGSTSGGGMGGMGVAGEAWRLAAEKAGINVEALSQTEKDILRTGGVKAYQEYLWEDERTKAKK